MAAGKSVHAREQRRLAELAVGLSCRGPELWRCRRADRRNRRRRTRWLPWSTRKTQRRLSRDARPWCADRAASRRRMTDGLCYPRQQLRCRSTNIPVVNASGAWKCFSVRVARRMGRSRPVPSVGARALRSVFSRFAVAMDIEWGDFDQMADLDADDPEAMEAYAKRVAEQTGQPFPDSFTEALSEDFDEGMLDEE